MSEDVPAVAESGMFIRHGIIPVAALGILLVISVAVLMKKEYLPPAEMATQTASAAQVQDVFQGITLIAKAAIVVDLKSKKILYAKNQDAQLPLASMSKVALALAVSDALPADTIITITRDTAPNGNAERLSRGEKWRAQDVLDFTLLSSSNEGAEILASAADEAIRAKNPDAPSGIAAVWRMNALAWELGLRRTYFLNASGLDISPTLSGAYGSARDMSALFAYAATERLQVFARTANDGVTLTSADGRRTARAFNTNEAQGEIPGLIMGKTGTTDLAGGNLAVVFDIDTGHPVVAIILGSTREGRFSDMLQIVSRTREAVLGRDGKPAITAD